MEECSEASQYSSDEDIVCPGLLFRMKVFVLGDLGCGKTSLVHALISPNLTPSVAPPATTTTTAIATSTSPGSANKASTNGHSASSDLGSEAVTVELWSPFKTSDSASLLDRHLTGEERHLILEIWDLSGRQVCLDAQQVFLTGEAIYLLVFNSLDQTSRDSVLPLYTLVQHRFPGAVVLVVGTQSDRAPGEGNRQAGGEELLRGLQVAADSWSQAVREESDTLRSLQKNLLGKQAETSSKTKNRSENRGNSFRGDENEAARQARLCEARLRRPYRVPRKVYRVSSLSGLGLDELRKELLETALDRSLFPHYDRTVKPGTVAIYDAILRLREAEVIVLPWQQYCDAVTKNNGVSGDFSLEEETAFLELVGGLLDFRFEQANSCAQLLADSSGSEGGGSGWSSARYVCVYPCVLAHCLCTCLLDEDRRAFRLEAARFWPRDSGFKRPDPQVLAKVLEAVPTQGVVRESVLPLLWQEHCLSEEQVLLVVEVLYGLGLLVPGGMAKSHCEGLALPDFPRLSVQRCHALTLLDLLPDVRPQLNWTPKPFRGDLQLNWRLRFPLGLPRRVAKRLLAHCQHVTQRLATYRHVWKQGLLLRLAEATVCVSEEDKEVTVGCRVNGDEAGQEDTACQLLWLLLATVLTSAQRFLHTHWPGLLVQHWLTALGQGFYNDERVETEPVQPLAQAFLLWLSGRKFTFKDGDTEKELDLSLVFPFKARHGLLTLEDFLDHVLTQRTLILKAAGVSLEGASSEFPPSSNSILHRRSTRNKSRRKKNVEVKWSLEHKIVPSEPTSSVDTSTRTDCGPCVTSVKSLASVAEAPTPSVDSPPGDETPDPVASDNKDTARRGESQAAASPNTVILRPGQHVISDEDHLKEVTRVASGFVAAVMATAVAEFVSLERENNKNMVSAAQVEAAKLAAGAAVAAQSGDMEGAAQAVLQAVRALEAAQDCSPGRAGQPRKSAKSKLCRIL